MAGAPAGGTEPPSTARQLMKILQKPVHLPLALAVITSFVRCRRPVFSLDTRILFVILIIDLFDLEIVVTFQFADHLLGIPRDDRLHDPVMNVEHQFDA